MPFTLSHPAAALPLARLLPWAAPAALAIGSMAPDFPYFIGFPDARADTHSFASVLWFSVPAGCAVYLAFERWLRAAWSDLLPQALAARVAREAPRVPWLAVLASLALGAATHVLWDSFTHEHQPGVVLVRALNVVVIQLLGFPVRGYNLLQHGSTLIGAGLLAFWLHRWLRRTEPRALPPSYAPAARARSARSAAPARRHRACGARVCVRRGAAERAARGAAQLRRRRRGERDQPHARGAVRLCGVVAAQCSAEAGGLKNRMLRDGAARSALALRASVMRSCAAERTEIASVFAAR